MQCEWARMRIHARLLRASRLTIAFEQGLHAGPCNLILLFGSIGLGDERIAELLQPCDDVCARDAMVQGCLVG